MCCWATRSRCGPKPWSRHWGAVASQPRPAAGSDTGRIARAAGHLDVANDPPVAAEHQPIGRPVNRVFHAQRNSARQAPAKTSSKKQEMAG